MTTMLEKARPADATDEIKTGDRFAFGDNWRQFLDLLDDDRIAAAERSLKERLGRTDLTGLRFVDIGCGSGLFSLAARNLGADVVSFDFDAQSVACANELRRRYWPDDTSWEVMTGSALDPDFLAGLGTFDIVYSWGVLHHTGNMWTALDLAAERVGAGGQLFIAIYNDQGWTSRVWRGVKASYNRGGSKQRALLVEASASYFGARHLVGRCINARRGATAVAPRGRGMDRRRDLVDWVGGFPFEVATPEQIFRFYRDRGFVLDEMTTCGGGLGCNEFVFTRNA